MIEDGGGDAAAIAAEMGFEAMDSGALEAIVDAAIAAQPDAWAKYLAGERKALGAIVGQVMKASKGQADGKLVNEIVERRARRPVQPTELAEIGRRSVVSDSR